MVLLLLYYVWRTLTSGTGAFALYSDEQLMTYLFGGNILRAFVFGTQSRRVALEINDGAFSQYLVKPANHFWYCYARELAGRILATISAAVEAAGISLLLDINFFWQTDPVLLSWFALAVLLAHILYYFLSYGMSLIAFWSREAMGPRFLFEWLLEFASGAYFPLDILKAAFARIFIFLPFAYLIFSPLSLYLGGSGPPGWIVAAWQLLWIAIAALSVFFLWRRGLRRYSGEGI
ncbi:MAG: hypothetical protein UY92_C0003G0058 [Candidatus Magasanikbacteria bacterium GW2011_GWA2_56_11]|uniref:ABC transporter permease protein n=1 Tax=Candidatus Magasanikbacteria bacterium GW2011_GWA2_56_11 TaxID=1619044 RepID=A0A0G2ANC7_9BACT|nr:MAG: hypothetical protein UY92_C0003G0058 [Candidatus Magasanikbacteria bacterium GW2011_GWA2_56_11]